MALVLLLLYVASVLLSSTSAFSVPNPIEVITRDFQALTRRVTAYHILLPKSQDVALALKQKIRNANSPMKGSDSKPMYIVDAFCIAGKKYSQDKDVGINGGLLGTLAPQGYCRAKELDKACYEVPLGEVSGPIESDFGYHLLLVTERTNCPKLDGGYTEIRRSEKDGVSTVFAKGGARESDFSVQDASTVLLQQVGFWMGVSLAGGIVAELAAKAANVVDTVPWE